jgi:Ca2+-transporting ATPase
MSTPWYTISPDETLQILQSRRAGLTQSEAQARLLQHGHNELKGKKKTPLVMVFLRQFLSPLIYVLLAAAVVSAIIQHFIDAAVIMVAVLVGVSIGFVQETRAEKAMEALSKLAAPKAKVRRDGKTMIIPARDIVPGDVLILETGDKVPADARLIEVSNLKVNESILTGESMPVDKHTEPLHEEVPVAERKNTVFMSTTVTYGRATAVAVRTGMATEIGRIASAIQEIKVEQTPLQKSIAKLSRYLVIVLLSICAVLAIIGIFRGLDPVEVFLLTVAAAVSAIPEGLPAVVTLVLAMGMRMMAHRHALVRKLVAVETLGAATVICSDKTGTLTMNEMTAQRIYLDSRMIEVSGQGYDPRGDFRRNGEPVNPLNDPSLVLALRIGALCNDSLLTCEDGFCTIYGDPTEGALVVLATKAGLNKEKMEKTYPRLDEIPFQSEKQYMATLHPRDGGRVAYVKGSVEKLLSMSKSILKDGQGLPMSDADAEAIMEANQSMAKEAMRVIALAYADFPSELEDLKDEDIRGNLTFVGMVGMADQPREEARDAIRLCRQAGIKVIMITGDNKITAEAIASKLDLPAGKAVTGTELAKMSDEELSREIERISVFARIEPLHKLRIVNALKSHGHIVAMTGDGVNDAPALKSANIGVAMGITGTDVAKEASDMILTDDNFVSVVAAVEEGRAIFNRLRNVLFFLLSTNIGELIALIATIAVIGKAPLLAVQILWNNLVTGTMVTAPLGLEPKSGDELKQPPRHPRVGLLYRGLLYRIGFLSTLMGIGIFAVFAWAQTHVSIEEARTMAFCTMVTFEWFRAFNARSDEYTVFKLGLFRNRWLVAAISLAIMLQLAVIYLPFFQTVFKTVPLSPERWGIVILAGGTLFTVEELRKLLFPKLFSAGKWRPVNKKQINKR